MKSGSSPLTRGKRPIRRDGRAPTGLIPAHAGKTPVPIQPNQVVGAHPRSRGENSCWYCLIAVNVGSSPLTRGKRAVERDGSGGAGLIPAHAGKTGAVGLGWLGMGAHPRSRGENRWLHCRQVTRAGSSPLTRGKRRRSLQLGREPGLIPAHAGKTTIAASDALIMTAHPRSRGENVKW